MLKTRLIPVLLLKDGLLVRSEEFSYHQIIGDPIHEVQRLSEWNVDELIYIDIARGEVYDQRRDDTIHGTLNSSLDILDAVSRSCFMPLTWGGKITSVADMRRFISRGADKITVNSAAFRNPELISQGASMFGSQAIVVSIDAKRTEDGYRTFIDGGRTDTGTDPADWASEAQRLGAGEVLLQSIDRDGTGEGYDLDLIARVTQTTSIPVIACGGVGAFSDYAEGIRAGASAVAAANIWHFKELADALGKKAMMKEHIPVRSGRK